MRPYFVAPFSRTVFTLIAAVVCSAFLGERATAGPFTTVTLESGAFFQIDGTDISNSNPVGTDGTYKFGFSNSSDPIKVTHGSTTYYFTGIEDVFLLNTTSTRTTTANVYDYSNSGTGTWDQGKSPGSSSKDGYTNGNFGNNSTLLAMSQDANGAKSSYGDFSFTSIGSPSSAEFGFHARYYTGTYPGAGNLQTAFFVLEPGGGPNPPVGSAPAPPSVVLFGFGGIGLAFYLARSRRQLAAAM